MNNELASLLIEKQVIRKRRTRIRCICDVLAMGGIPIKADSTLIVDDIYCNSEGTITFKASSSNGRKYLVPASQIFEIDGMNPDRMAAAFDVKPDGSLKAMGKRRGRKPKNRSNDAVNI